MRLFSLMTLTTVLVAACGEMEGGDGKGTSTGTSTATGTGTGAGTGTATGTGTASTIPFTGTLEAASYDAATHSVKVKVGYGGCGKKQLTLVVGACMETFPAQCSGMLHEPAPTGDAECAMFVTDEHTLALPATLEDSYLTIAGATAAGIQLLVDKDGSLTPPFAGPVKDLSFDAATNAVTMKLGVHDASCGGVQEFRLDLAPECKDAAKMAAAKVCAGTLRHVQGANVPACGAEVDKPVSFPLTDVATTEAYELEIKVQDDTLKLAVPKK